MVQLQHKDTLLFTDPKFSFESDSNKNKTIKNMKSLKTSFNL